MTSTERDWQHAEEFEKQGLHRVPPVVEAREAFFTKIMENAISQDVFDRIYVGGPVIFGRGKTGLLEAGFKLRSCN